MGTSKNSFSMKSAAPLRDSSSLEVANNAIIGHFSFLLSLGLAQFHGRKPIFRGALYNKKTALPWCTAVFFMGE